MQKEKKAKTKARQERPPRKTRDAAPSSKPAVARSKVGNTKSRKIKKLEAGTLSMAVGLGMYGRLGDTNSHAKGRLML
jgi:hypothetical protein